MPRVRDTQPKPSKPSQDLPAMRREFAANRAATVALGHKLEDVKYAIQSAAREICDGEECTPSMWLTASRQVLGFTRDTKTLGY